MQKTPLNIRIGMVPRADLLPRSNEENSPSNIHKQIHHQDSHATSGLDPYSDQQQIIRFTSPNNIRLHDVNEIHSNAHQSQTNGLNQHRPLSVTHTHQETVSELCEIPSKATVLKSKKIVLGVVAAIVVGLMIVVGVVLGVVLTRSENTSATTTASTSITTTIAPNVISAVWSFDNVTTELYGVYNSSSINSPIYSNSTSQTFPYFGSGQALLLNGVNQFVLVSSPFLPLNSTSFTIEAWIYPLNISSDRGIFGQCQCSTCANQCFYFICRGGRLFVDFTLNDLWGSTTMAMSTWYHVAFVYNSQTQQQILFVNGVQDAIKSNAASYQGTNGSIQIGASQAFGTTNFFAGLIDNVWITTRAKPADEILRDASLIVYFPFDLPNPNADGGPNKLSGTPVSTVTTSGYVNQAMRFVGLLSYFAMFGLYQVPTGLTTNRPFSVSLWINPSASGSSSFLQLFSTPYFRCSNLLGIVSGGGSTGQIFVHSSNSVPATLTGPFVTQNVWTHISVTYSASIGYTLYFNGVYYGATGSVVYQSGTTLATLYVGFFNSCVFASYNSPYQGSIDEVYVHNRELTQADVTLLANP